MLHNQLNFKPPELQDFEIHLENGLPKIASKKVGFFWFRKISLWKYGLCNGYVISCPSFNRCLVCRVMWCVGLVALLHFLFGFAQLEKCKCATNHKYLWNNKNLWVNAWTVLSLSAPLLPNSFWLIFGSFGSFLAQSVMNVPFSASLQKEDLFID